MAASFVPMWTPSYGGSNLGGGPFNGFSPTQTNINKKDSESTLNRRVLRDVWNARYVTDKINGYNRAVTPFRAVENLGDYLGRVNYSCGGPNPQSAKKPGYGRLIGSVPQHCDATGIPPSTCNPKFVPDSSDYVRFKKLRAINHTYNDLSYVGNASNGSYVSLVGVRRR
jgi:hypothetical protein